MHSTKSLQWPSVHLPDVAGRIRLLALVSSKKVKGVFDFLGGDAYLRRFGARMAGRPGQYSKNRVHAQRELS